MRLRNRLTYLSSITFGIVFIGTSLMVYLVFVNTSQKMYFDNLKSNSLLTAFYYLEKDELTQYEHSSIRQEFYNSINSSNVAIYNSSNQVQYGNLIQDTSISIEDLNTVRQSKKQQFKRNGSFYYGMYYPDNQGDFVIFIKASTEAFQQQANTLLFILVVVLCLGLILIFLLSKKLSAIAYRPIQQVVQQINQINYSNLNQEIAVTHTHKEVDELIVTYNKLISRLSENFLIQKNFINYVSHEFKTPLTAIAGNLEVFAQKDRTPQEYKLVAQQSLENVYKIESILSNLLLMSGINQVESTSENFRMDEVIWNIIDILNNQDPLNGTRIKVDLQVEHASVLEITGNQTLLQLALFNIIENALKYSKPKLVTITLLQAHGKLKVQILDQGTGIHESDLQYIGQTFFRGKNVQDIKGNGIGLSLARLIFEQHHIDFKLESSYNVQTLVTLEF